MESFEVDAYELEVLVEAIYKRHGYDFRHYAKASLRRRFQKQLQKINGTYLSELLPRLLYDKDAFSDLLLDLSVGTTEMFRDPHFFKVLREEVISHLKTYPFIKIWHAGCSTGEEVYSTAIVLHEAGILPYAYIYATDFNEKSLTLAKRGIYGLKQLGAWEQNYLDSGGKKRLSDYYHAEYNSGKFHDFLKERVVFSNHNLAGGGVFGEMNLILCRNVLIYFDRELQNKVLRLFLDSLVNKGFLGLGTKESIQFSGVKESFSLVSESANIYQAQPAAIGRTS